ncbi:MAG: histone deacetylase [Nitrospirae bacterium]|nr:histone deacetylase [Nitrospirota bacterium]
MSRVGLLYSDVFLGHRTWQHPEKSERLQWITSGLTSSGLHDRLDTVVPRPATEEDIARVHTLSHIETIRATQGSPRAQLDADTQTSEGSYEAAVLAVGGLCEAVDRVMDGKLDSVFAMVRPPGHHAERDRAMGFCLFNNIAIAAAYARSKHKLDRILIVDWDVHHGNGTQHAFFEDPHCLYVSTHQYPFYPGTGHYRDVGMGEGEGFTVNVPLPAGQGDGEFRAIFDEVILPIATEYRPQIVMISAGFDAHKDDPLAGMGLTGPGYGYMTRALKSVASASADGKLVVALEGGYSETGLQEGTQAVFHALLNDPMVKTPAASVRIKDYVGDLKKNFKPFWKSL